MKKYLGVKIVSAEPMVSENAFAAGLIRADIVEPGVEGYKVVYGDGYASWSPKEVFEKAYKEIEEPETPETPEDASVTLDVDVRTGEWVELLPENLKVSQPESLSRIDLLKQFALSQAVKYTALLPSPSASGVIAASNVFFEYLAE